MNKPLLVLPPSPSRWTAIESLLEHESPARLADLRLRLCDPPAGANDALALQPDGAHARAFACLRRRHEIGVLGHIFTHADHRRRGLARQLMQTLLSWFDMTGGKWLYALCPADVYAAFLEHFGFRVLHRGGAAHDTLALLRTPGSVTGDPIEHSGGSIAIREATRADWPLIVALLQHRLGPDGRVSLSESALSAEGTVFDLLGQADRGVCSLLAAARGHQVIAVGSLAIDQLGQRSYAMILPHGDPNAEPVRAAVLELAAKKGYAQVDFPLDVVAAAGH